MNTHDKLALVEASSAIIGYVSGLKAGTIIGQSYVDRLNTHYIPKLRKTVDHIVDLE